MSNDRILKYIQELLKNECFSNNEAFQIFIKQSKIAPSIILQAVTDLYNSLIEVISDIVECCIEEFRTGIDEAIEELSENTSQVRYQVGYSYLYRNKIKLQILKTKRLWKRQKIP